MSFSITRDSHDDTLNSNTWWLIKISLPFILQCYNVIWQYRVSINDTLNYVKLWIGFAPIRNNCLKLVLVTEESFFRRDKDENCAVFLLNNKCQNCKISRLLNILVSEFRLNPLPWLGNASNYALFHNFQVFVIPLFHYCLQSMCGSNECRIIRNVRLYFKQGKEGWPET